MSKYSRNFHKVAAVTLLLALGACAGESPTSPKTGSRFTSNNGYYKVGQPYQINGTWYYPKEDYSYDETGIASWYGADFHRQRTANGEIFNKNELTAAHATLPMPSLARVTNLENGRSLVVRINDRGPFANSRIIDVSQRAAQLLGFEKQGTAKVRVQVLSDESRAIADAMRRYGTSSPEPVMVASTENNIPVTQAIPLTQQLQETPLLTNGNVQTQTLEPLPTTKAEAHAMMASIKPVQEIRQLPVTGQQQIYIQAGAFTKMENAAKLQQKLIKIGQVRVANADIKGVRFYRVRVGPIPDVATADKILSKVVQSGQREARIVVD